MISQNQAKDNKLLITKCIRKEDTATKQFSTEVTDEHFEAMLNPDGYSRQWGISYNKDKALGQPSSEEKFSKMETSKVSIKKLLVDGTGVVQKGGPSVTDRIEQLKKIVYTYNGDAHEPNRIRLIWGTLKFFGHLTSLSVEYTLFDPDGIPLRAEISMEIHDATTTDEAQLLAKLSSPDLTHLIEVVAGDNLPLLCHRIYGNPAYYPDVARINNLCDFVTLKPGMQLRFPPLK